jgi:hypothetical protein
MQVKLVLGGEAVNIPDTSIGMGVAFVKVWMDGNGFTSASNDLGALGYILLETPTVDIGTLDPERQKLFTHLHGSVVQFKIKTNIFAKDGGIARISMTVPTQDGGSINEKTISFTADDCTGVSIVSNELSFSAEMLMMENKLASNQSFISQDDIAAAANAAPKGQDQDQAVATAGGSSSASQDQGSGAPQGQDQDQSVATSDTGSNDSQSQDQTVASSDGATADGQDQSDTSSQDTSSQDQDQTASTDNADSADGQDQPQDQGQTVASSDGDAQDDTSTADTPEDQVPA